MPPVLWTIGHSTRQIEDFVGLLQTHSIQLLIDVRAIPYSRRNPQFCKDALAQSLAGAEVRYAGLPALGGRRQSRPGSINAGWRNSSFRGYADYMQTAPFWTVLEALIALAGDSRTAVMCAEAVPWRCHRSLIADAMTIRGWTVQHILTATKAGPHSLTSFAEVHNGLLSYPNPPKTDPSPGLF
ncbi:MAG: DUF488 domain-containing protein [Nitrospirales bacterium]